MRAGHLNNGFIMTMTSLMYSQQSTAHFCIGLISLFFYPALFIMPLFLGIYLDARWLRASEESFEVRHVVCVWPGVVRPLSSHSWSDSCTMATLNSVGHQAVMCGSCCSNVMNLILLALPLGTTPTSHAHTN